MKTKNIQGDEKMKTYDDIEGFIDYTNKEEWKSYITNSIIPLLGIT